VPACLGKKKSMLATKTPSTKKKKKDEKKKKKKSAEQRCSTKRVEHDCNDLPANKYLYTAKRSFLGINLNIWHFARTTRKKKKKKKKRVSTKKKI
jgi:hypothetical protein